MVAGRQIYQVGCFGGHGKERKKGVCPWGGELTGKRGVVAEEGELRGGSLWRAGKVIVIEVRGGCRGCWRERLMEKKVGAGWPVHRRKEPMGREVKRWLASEEEGGLAGERKRKKERKSEGVATASKGARDCNPQNKRKRLEFVRVFYCYFFDFFIFRVPLPLSLLGNLISIYREKFSHSFHFTL